MKNLKIVQTGDGSDTIYLQDLEESYHSLSGAYTESRHVFIRNGLFRMIKNFFGDESDKNQSMGIVEVGFGTGLNAMLTYEQCLLMGLNLCYIGLEPHPLPSFVVDELNYKKFFDSRIVERWNELHHLPWEKKHVWQGDSSQENFSFIKTKSSIENFAIDDLFSKKDRPKIKLIYFDAFASSKQKEIWSPEVFSKLACLIERGGCLVTYGASGELRRNLQKSGWRWQSLPGAMEKREMTFATFG